MTESKMIKKTTQGKSPPKRSRSKHVRETQGTYSTLPTPNKKVLREMLEVYKHWNIEKENLRIEKERNRTSTEAFEDYLQLWEFAQEFASHHPYSRQEKVESMVRYYERIKKFEAWRRARAEKSWSRTA